MDSTEVISARSTRGRTPLEAYRATRMPYLVHGVLMIALGVAAVGLGAGIVSFLDEFRADALNSIFGDPGPVRHVVLFDLGTYALFAVILLTLAVTTTAQWATGRQLDFPVLGTIPVVLVGVAIGVTISVPWMTPAAVVGRRVDTSFGSPDELWNGWDWAWYRFDLWGPIVAIALAVCALLVAVIVRMRRSRTRHALRHVLSHGAIVPGIVTAAPSFVRTHDPATSPTNTRMRGDLVARFTDPTGTVRHVAQVSAFHVGDVPVVGQPVAVLMDPQAPADTKRVWLAPAGARSERDFRAWRVGT